MFAAIPSDGAGKEIAKARVDRDFMETRIEALSRAHASNARSLICSILKVRCLALWAVGEQTIGELCV
jgi:hypothetical protein